MTRWLLLVPAAALAAGCGGASHTARPVVASAPASHDLVITAQFDAMAAAEGDCPNAGNLPGQLTVKNQSGTILGVAPLSDLSAADSSTCQGDYDVTVRDASFYVVSVDGRSNQLTYAADALAADGWHEAITL